MCCCSRDPIVEVNEDAYSLAFFDRHLLGRPAALHDGPAKQYPEMFFETRQSR